MSVHPRDFRGGQQRQRGLSPARHPSLPPLKTAAQMPEQGKIKFYDRRRGYGFIEQAGQDDTLLHASVVDKYGIHDRQLEGGVPVRFSLDSDPKRRRAADAVQVIPG